MVKKKDIDQAMCKIEKLVLQIQGSKISEIDRNEIREGFEEEGRFELKFHLPEPDFQNSIVIKGVRVEGPDRVANNLAFGKKSMFIINRFEEEFGNQVSMYLNQDKDGIYKLSVQIIL